MKKFSHLSSIFISYFRKKCFEYSQRENMMLQIFGNMRFLSQYDVQMHAFPIFSTFPVFLYAN